MSLRPLQQPITTQACVLMLMSILLIVNYGCQNTPRIEIPRELTPGMTLYLNERVDSSLISAPFHEEYVPSGLPLGVRDAPRYVYVDSSTDVHRSIELDEDQKLDRLTTITLTWESNRGIDPDPQLDSLADDIVMFLRSKYRKPFTLENITPFWVSGDQLVDRHLKVLVSIHRTKEEYQCLVSFIYIP